MTASPEHALQTFYRDEYAEAERLTRSPSGRLERTRTEELLRRHLPAPPARVLDVGAEPACTEPVRGAPGPRRAGAAGRGGRGPCP